MKAKILFIRMQRERFDEDLRILNEFLRTNTVYIIENEILKGRECDYWNILIFYKEGYHEGEGLDLSYLRDIDYWKIHAHNLNILNEKEQKQFDELKKWRTDKAIYTQMPANQLVTDKGLKKIVKYKVSDVKQLLKIKELKYVVADIYGHEIIKIMNDIEK